MFFLEVCILTEAQFAGALLIDVVVLIVAFFFRGLPVILVKLSEKSKPSCESHISYKPSLPGGESADMYVLQMFESRDKR